MADVIAPGAPEQNGSVSFASPSLSSENQESITQTQESGIKQSNRDLLLNYIVKSEIAYLVGHLKQINDIRKHKNKDTIVQTAIGSMYGYKGNIYSSTQSHSKNSSRPTQALTRPSYLEGSESSDVWIPTILLSLSAQELTLRASNPEFQCMPLGPPEDICAWRSVHHDAQEPPITRGRPRGSRNNKNKVVESFFDIKARHFIEDSFQPPHVMTPYDEAAIQDLASDDQILRGESLETHNIFRFRDVPTIDQGGFVSGTCARTGREIKFLWADHPHKVIICDAKSTWVQAYCMFERSDCNKKQLDNRLEELKEHESFRHADRQTQVIFPRMSLKLQLNMIALNVICIFCLTA
jgi:hypothetical protein